MRKYIAPRRFSRLWEMDHNGPPMCGSLEEQQTCRDAIGNYVEWNNPYDRVLFALTKEVKRTGRKYLPISLLHEEGRQSFWGRTGGAIIQLFPPDRVVAQSEWDFVLSHEIGHVVGMKLLDNDRTEMWAVMFQQWVMYGQDQTFGYVHDKLAAVGALDSVVVPIP